MKRKLEFGLESTRHPKCIVAQTRALIVAVAVLRWRNIWTFGLELFFCAAGVGKCVALCAAQHFLAPDENKKSFFAGGEKKRRGTFYVRRRRKNVTSTVTTLCRVVFGHIFTHICRIFWPPAAWGATPGALRKPSGPPCRG